MFDFPNAPITGQVTTTPAGSSFTWDGTKWVAAGGTASAFNNAGRNLLHNPMFIVTQRGTGPFVTNGVYTADRWVMVFSDDSTSITIGAASDTDRSQIGDEACSTILSNAFTGNAAASAFNMLSQRLEGVRKLAGKTVAVSFYARVVAGAATKLGVGTGQSFGTGGSPSAAVFGTGQSVTITSTWQRFALQFTFPSAAGKTLGTNLDDFSAIEFWFSSGTTLAARAGNPGVQSGTVALWGMQLELGNVASPLEKVDIADDVARCMRFYQIGNFIVTGFFGGVATITHQVGLPVVMRANPTVVPTTATNANCSAATVLSADARFVIIQSATAAAAATWLGGTFTASADYL